MKIKNIFTVLLRIEVLSLKAFLFFSVISSNALLTLSFTYIDLLLFRQLNGGSADVDGRISKGDLLVSVNGQSTVNVSADEAGAILKTVSGKATLKFHRYKPIIR